MKKRISLVVALVLLVMPLPAQAHIFIRDKQANIGAVVHVTPDDDPIAGKPATVTFTLDDSSAGYRAPYENYQLRITDSEGKASLAGMSVQDSAVIGTYTFPSQGVYRLTLSARALNGKQIVLQDTIRVGRGVRKAAVQPVAYAWANLLLGNAGFGITALLLIILIKRREIAAYMRQENDTLT